MINENIIGEIVLIRDIRYRVLGTVGNITSLCDMDSNKLTIVSYPTDELKRQIRNNEILIQAEESVAIDFSKMSEEERKVYDSKIAFLHQMDAEYGPTYVGLIGRHKKKLLEVGIKKTGMSSATVYRLIRKYLQAGMSPAAIVDKRYSSTPSTEKKEYEYRKKAGRKNEFGTGANVILTPEIKQQFTEFLNAYKNGRERTYKYAYQGLLDKYYTYPAHDGFLPQRKPATECPTFEQFYYYCRTHLTKEEKDQIKTSVAEQRNAQRLLLGSSRTDAIRPGWIVEADALEADFSIVSSINREQSIGRPIVYVMIDVYTSTIVAISAAFDNNSYVGITNLMMNLCDDKVEYAKKFGIIIEPGMWPSNFIPHEIRCDRGSDFKSDKFTTVCRRLGINRTLETGATGSMKGLVEQSFHQYQTQLRPHMEKKGLITRRYDSNHHREAMITMETFTALLINFVVHHNQKAIEEYHMTKDMIEKGILPAPISLWNYGCAMFGNPKMITEASKLQYLYDLMIEAEASIGRNGLKYKNLYYISSDRMLLGRMYSLGNRKDKMTVRYDPRDVGHLYYISDGKVCAALLNSEIPGNADYMNMSWEQYAEYQKARKELKAKGEEINNETNFGMYQINNVIIENAMTEHLSDKTGIRPARQKSKQINNNSNKIATRLENTEINESYNLLKTDTVKDETVKSIDNAEDSKHTDVIIIQEPEKEVDDPFSLEEDLAAALKAHRKSRRNG